MSIQENQSSKLSKRDVVLMLTNGGLVTGVTLTCLGLREMLQITVKPEPKGEGGVLEGDAMAPELTEQTRDRKWTFFCSTMIGLWLTMTSYAIDTRLKRDPDYFSR